MRKPRSAAIIAVPSKDLSILSKYTATWSSASSASFLAFSLSRTAFFSALTFAVSSLFSIYEDDVWKQELWPDKINESYLTDFFIDSKNRKWFLVYEDGAYYKDGNDWFLLNEKNGLPDNYVLEIEENTEGDIIIGTEYGVNIFNGGNVNFNTQLKTQ